MTNPKPTAITIRALRRAHAPTFNNQLDFDILLSAAITRSKEFLYAHDEHTLSAMEQRRWNTYLKDYTNGYSIAAITGHKEFYGRDFYVNKKVLIPRPDTETLVEAAIKKINSTDNKKLTLIDVGTGSGCIPISIRKEVFKKNIFTIATDVSPAALKVGRKNARQHNVKISFLTSNLLSRLQATIYKLPTNSTLIITANLPYLTDKQLRSEPSIEREPRLALVAKDNGLALYKTLLKQTKKLVENYRPAELCLFFEIDPAQDKPLTQFIKTLFPEAVCGTIPDLAGLSRVITLTLTPSLTHNHHGIRHKQNASTQKK